MKPYLVAVCDDNPDDLEQLKLLSSHILTRNGIPHEVHGYQDELALIDATRHIANAYDLVILDILLEECNGVEVARKLRANGADSTIVFITTSPDFAIRGYEVGAYRYLLKPVSDKDLEAVMLSAYRAKSEHKELVFHLGAATRRIPVRRILYIETKGRGVAVHLQDEVFDVPEKISDIERRMPPGELVRCHRSYMINLAHVDLVKRYGALIHTKTELPIGKMYYDEVKRRMLERLSR